MSSARLPDDRADAPSQSRLTWLIPLGLVALLGLLYAFWPAFQAFADEAYAVAASGDQERMQAWVQGFSPWGFAIILGLMLAQSILAVIPSMLMMVVAVLAYGPLVGGVLAWGGLLLAATLAYGIGRALGPVTVDRLVGAKTERKVARFVDRYGIWGIIAARVAPAISTDAVSFVAGLVEMRYVRFILATAVGTLPLTVLVAWLGRDIDRLQTGLIWVSVVSLVLFVGYVVYDRKVKGGG